LRWVTRPPARLCRIAAPISQIAGSRSFSVHNERPAAGNDLPEAAGARILLQIAPDFENGVANEEDIA
jgi:hypothetical protein